MTALDPGRVKTRLSVNELRFELSHRYLPLSSRWLMKRFIQGIDRTQGILLPEQLDDYVTEENPCG